MPGSIKKLRLVFVLILFLSSILPSKATHRFGGEITWECLSPGNIRVQLNLYWNCESYSVHYPDTIILKSEIPGYSQFKVARDTIYDVTSDCYCGTDSIYCGMPYTTPHKGAVKVWSYSTDIHYPTGLILPSTPPASGWVISWWDCCRPAFQNLTHAYMTIRSVIYPGDTTSTSFCDNSPVFDKHALAFCSGYQNNYNYGCSDQDLDSLVFEWGEPIANSGYLTPNVFWGTPCTFDPGYLYNSPLPDVTQNALNIPATINPHTGTVIFTSYTTGNFYTCYKVTAYKNGFKTAEVFRDAPIFINSCNPNWAPTANITNGLYVTSSNYEYGDTFYAGDTVTFTVNGTDLGNCSNFQPQGVYLKAFGSQLDTPINIASCPNPPCAFLSPSPTNTTPIGGGTSVSSDFFWETNCGHLSMNSSQLPQNTLYNFHFEIQDGFCPVPRKKTLTATIVLIPPPPLDPPEIKCADVNSGGGVELKWPCIKDTLSNFSQYKIYYSSNISGPFILLDSIQNLNSGSYYHSSASANTGPAYYYMITESSCGTSNSSVPSDTISSIFLSKTTLMPYTAIQLEWNPTHIPAIPGSSEWYYIYRKKVFNSWHLVDSTKNLFYRDTNFVCNAFFDYRIETTVQYYDTLNNPTYCVSGSNDIGYLFMDLYPPSFPQNIHVTVDTTTNMPVLSWEADSSEGIIGFIIYQNDYGFWYVLDTVFSDTLAVWSDYTKVSCDGPYLYNVAALDSCYNMSYMGYEVRTVSLKILPDHCNKSVTLKWTPYINSISPILAHNIYQSVDGGPFSLIATLGANDTIFVNSGLGNSVYTYYVEVVMANGINSNSCLQSVYLRPPSKPQFVHIKNATVEDNSHVLLKIHTDISTSSAGIVIQRSDDGTNYSTIDTADFIGIAKVLYKDLSADFNSRSYYYRVIALDSCGILSDTSAIARTIYLEAVQDLDHTMTKLLWNEYFGFLGSPVNYELYRMINGSYQPLPIFTTPTGIWMYTDNYINVEIDENEVRYKIKAVEGPGNPYLFTEISESNEVSISFEALIYIPNAFYPEGGVPENQTFKPYGMFFSGNGYEFSIYNRLGQQIFMTTDPEESWDGSFEGELCSSDVYSYLIIYRNSAGDIVTETGTVTLIR